MVSAILAGPMNLRTLAGRDGAMLLAVAWTAFGAAALFSSVAGGELAHPWLLFPFLPAAVGLAAALRPGESHGRRAALRLALAVAALLVVASLAQTFGAAAGANRPIVAPSMAITYAMLAGSALTVAHAVVGWRPSPAASLRLGSPLVAVLAVAAFGSAALAGSPGAPACAVPERAPSSSLRLFVHGDVDGAPRGSVSVGGRRDGDTERWAAVGGGAGEFSIGEAMGTLLGDGVLEARLAAVLRQLAGPATEDLGVERVAGDPARHCRILISGPQAFAAFPALHVLLPGGARDAGGVAGAMTAPADAGEPLPAWRGELDWWLAPDGTLVRAEARVGGHPADAWGDRGLRGRLRLALTIELPEAAAGAVP